MHKYHLFLLFLVLVLVLVLGNPCKPVDKNGHRKVENRIDQHNSKIPPPFAIVDREC